MKYYHWLLIAVFLPLCIVWAAPPIGTTTTTRDRGYVKYSTAHKDDWATMRGKLDASTFSAYTSIDRVTNAQFSTYTSIERAGGGGDITTAQFETFSTATQNKLNEKLNTATFTAYTSIDRSGVTNATFTAYTTVARPTADEVAAGYSPLAKTANYIDAKSDFGCTGDGSTDDTTCITNALASAVSTGRPIRFIDGVFKTSGGFLINDPVTIIGEKARFLLSANATLFDISTNYATFDGIDVQVPDANTAAAVKITSSATRLQGRGWGPMRKVLWRNSRIVSTGALNWSQTEGSGEDTEGAWTGIELVCDTTAGNAGIDFIDISDTYIEFGATGIKTTKIGSGSAWWNGNYFSNINVFGFTTAFDGTGTGGFRGNTISGLYLHHMRGTAATGINLPSGSTGNTISISAWNDSGWTTTRSAFQPFVLSGTGNTLSGYAEYSAESPVSYDANNTINLQMWKTTEAAWSQETSGGVVEILHVGGTDLKVTGEAYDATDWDGNDTVPTKNDIRDKIETITTGTGITGTTDGLLAYYDATDSRYEQATGLFYNDTTPRLGINTVTPQFPVDAYGVTAAASRLVSRAELTSNAGGGSIVLMHNNAKVGSDFNPPASGDRLGNIFFGSMATTEASANSLFSAGLSSYTESAWVHNYYCRSSGVPFACCTGQGTGDCAASNDFSSDVRFETTESNSRTEKMRITGAGNVLIGNTDGTSKLTVTGTVSATAFVGDGSGLTGVAGAISQASIAAGGTVSCDNTIVTITSGTAGADTTLPADCIAGKILTVKNNSGAAQDVIAASGYIDDTPGLEWRIPSTGTSQFISEGTTLGWQAVKHPIPDCDNATTSKLLYDLSTNTYTCGTDQTGSGIAVGDTSVSITDTSDGYITITEDAAEVGRVTGARLGWGTPTPQFLGDFYVGATGSASFMIRKEHTTAGGGANLYLYHNNTKSGSDFTPPSANDRLGGVIFGGFTGTEASATIRNGAAITSYAEDTYVGGTDHSTNIRFETTPVDSATRAERLRIQADGKLRMSNQTAPATASTACTAGTFTFVSDYLYLCTATDTWKRVQITGTW